jgi:azurin
MKNSSLLLTLIILLSTSNFVAADSCNQVIEGNDMLQFNLKEMVVSSSCSEITVTLKHTGAMPANVMGHNWVLTNTADFMPVATAGGGAGLGNNYVPVNDARVIAASAVIGGGAETSVTFSGALLSVGGDYTFFCSFPGHYAIMKGSFVVRD